VETRARLLSRHVGEVCHSNVTRRRGSNPPGRGSVTRVSVFFLCAHYHFFVIFIIATLGSTFPSHGKPRYTAILVASIILGEMTSFIVGRGGMWNPNATIRLRRKELRFLVGLQAVSAGKMAFSEPPGAATLIFPSPMSRLWAGVTTLSQLWAGVTTLSQAADKRPSKRSDGGFIAIVEMNF
jgi:hypothetical protein